MAAEKLEKEKNLFPILDEAMEHLADASGFKLEITNGIPTWEAFPPLRHQMKVDAVCFSATPNSLHGIREGFTIVRDLTIQFLDGSVKRPDVSIFSTRTIEENTACRQIPEAVIEILSKGYEKKDTEVSLPFYLSWNIPDIVLFDPETNKVSHYHNGQVDEYDSPVDLTFACGCRATI